MAVIFFPHQWVKVPAVLLLTQSKHTAGGRHGWKAQVLCRWSQASVLAYKKLQREERQAAFSTSLLCARSLREISPCLKASDSSLYFPARSVHHSPPPAPPTTLQFLTSAVFTLAVAAASAFLCPDFFVLLNWHAGRQISLFPSTLINSFFFLPPPPSLSFGYVGSAAIFGTYGTPRKFVFASSHSRDAVIAATHEEKAPEEEMKVMATWRRLHLMLLPAFSCTSSPFIIFFPLKSKILNETISPFFFCFFLFGSFVFAS